MCARNISVHTVHNEISRSRDDNDTTAYCTFYRYFIIIVLILIDLFLKSPIYLTYTLAYNNTVYHFQQMCNP